MTSDHYRFEQVAAGAWAAIALDAGGAVGNAGFADLGGRALIIDCGYTPSAARDLRTAAEDLIGPVDRLIVTHPHLDHYGGAQVFADVPIVATATTRDTIAESGPTRIAELQEGMAAYLAELEEKDAPGWERLQAERVAAELPGMTLTPPTEVFAGELDLDAARLIECGGGHSPSDSVVFLPGPRVLFADDLIGVGGHMNLAHGDPQAWLEILDRLASLGPDHVVPGHGDCAGAEAIAIAREYIETLLELASRPGEPQMPAAYAGWDHAEGFQQNIDALRAR